MPELPEVQTLANALNLSYAGQKLAGVILRRDDIRFPLESAGLAKIFAKGATLVRFGREGKQLFILTDRGRVNISLGMSGGFFPSDLAMPMLHEHITLIFENGTKPLGYVDPRRFGFWKISNGRVLPEAECREGAGRKISPPNAPVDALDAGSLERLFAHKAVRSAVRCVKDVLMDQKFIGGLGNIYALEVLFEIGLHPQKRCVDIKPQQWRALAKAIPPMLEEAIRRGGSSVSSYRKPDGKKGGFQALHKVYGRHGQSCLKPGCKAVVIRLVQGGRSSWVCPRCQREPERPAPENASLSQRPKR